MTDTDSGGGVPVARGLVFGTAAEDYERYRRGYGPEVLALIRDYVNGPLRSAVEVGAGTGKATRLIAGAGIAVTALEPDPQMAGVLRRTTAALPVTIVEATFEQFSSDQQFDLLYAAAAWHWTDPSTRWARAAELLLPGGVLALFGGPSHLADPALRQEVEAIERDLFGDPGRTPGNPWTAEQAQADGHLVDITTTSAPGTDEIPRGQYVDRLRTVSAYLALDEPARNAALTRVGAALPGRVQIDSTIRILLARRPATN